MNFATQSPRSYELNTDDANNVYLGGIASVLDKSFISFWMAVEALPVDDTGFDSFLADTTTVAGSNV